MNAEKAAKETQPKPAAFIPPEAASAPPAAHPDFFGDDLRVWFFPSSLVFFVCLNFVRTRKGGNAEEHERRNRGKTSDERKENVSLSYSALLSPLELTRIDRVVNVMLRPRLLDHAFGPRKESPHRAEALRVRDAALLGGEGGCSQDLSDGLLWRHRRWRRRRRRWR